MANLTPALVQLAEEILAALRDAFAELLRRSRQILDRQDELLTGAAGDYAAR